MDFPRMAPRQSWSLVCSGWVGLWDLGPHGLIQDRLGSFSLFASSWDELCVRFRLAWARALHDAAGHRPTFEGLEEVDAVATQKCLSQFSVVDPVYLRCHLDGTLFVQNGRAKFDQAVDDRCPWCGAKGGIEHRAWTCPHCEPCRSHPFLVSATWLGFGPC